MTNRAKRVFITGGTGFFGKSMLDYRLRHPEWEWAKAEWVVLSRSPERFAARCPRLAKQTGVGFVVGDVRDFDFPAGHFDAIMHAATSAVDDLSDDEMTSVILDGTSRIIDFAKASGCKTVLFTSSGAVYGPRSEPAGEDDPCNPVTAYGKGKLAAEKLLLSTPGIDARIARCFAFVGPYLNRGIHYAIGNFIGNCLAKEPILIKGDGTPLRSYLYADDLVEWLFGILERGRPGRTYNVGSNKAVSIAELANVVRTALGSDNAVEISGAARDGKPSVYVPCTSRAEEELGLAVKVGLADSVRLSAGAA